jgi:hypothetical protein
MLDYSGLVSRGQRARLPEWSSTAQRSQVQRVLTGDPWELLLASRSLVDMLTSDAC